MKVHLLHKNQDFNLKEELPWNHEDLVQDLELTTLFGAMSNGNEFVQDVVKHVILGAVKTDADEVVYRQNILQDCLKNKSVVTEMYSIAVETIEKEKHNYWGIFSKYPDSVLYRSVDVLEMFVEMLRELRAIADEKSPNFASDGFLRLFRMLKHELSDDYFDTLKEYLRELKFRDGHLLSAQLGKGNKGTNYTLRKLSVPRLVWWKRLIKNYILPNWDGEQSWFRRVVDKEDSAFTFYISSRDEGGVRALRDLRDEGINHVANSLAQSNDHILGFFSSLKTELAFYMGCLNLHEQLKQMNAPVAFPQIEQQAEHTHIFTDLYDICLALTMNKRVVGNDVEAKNKKLVMITGANQGGKSTFLRSIGQSQLMMQSGMFVAADTYRANLCDSLITHFRREEDSGMKSGKLDEELDRMNQIINRLTSGAIILFNESFAATNEREGSEIARQIVTALLDHDIRVFFVTHLYEFASSFYQKKLTDTIFLKAERESDGSRSFKLKVGEPLQTSYGGDLYNEIFDR
jgi:hypothetical protein